MAKALMQTDLLGAKVYDGTDSDQLTNRQLAYYGCSSPAVIRAVFLDKEGSIKFLIVDKEGRSAEVYPCVVTIR